MNLKPVAHHSPAQMNLLTWVIRGAAVAAVLAALAISAPLIWTAVSAGLGLLSLAAIGLVGAAVFQTLPWLMQRLENRMLQARKAEARRNPIEQLENDCLRRQQRLVSFRQALVTIGARIESMKQMLHERSSIDPAHVLHRQQQALVKMAEFHEVNVRRLGEAQSALDSFRQTVEQKRFEWEFALGAEIIWESLNPSKVSELMQDLLTDEALRAVQLRFNQVFAELDIEMRSMNQPGRQLLDASQLDRMDALQLPTNLGQGSTS